MSWFTSEFAELSTNFICASGNQPSANISKLSYLITSIANSLHVLLSNTVSLIGKLTYALRDSLSFLSCGLMLNSMEVELERAGLRLHL